MFRHLPTLSNALRLLGSGLLALALAAALGGCGKKSKPAPKNEIISITLPPPPPPLPPPPPPKDEPPPPEEPEEQMMEQEPVAADEPPPDESPAPEEPPTDLTTGLTGDGPNNFGLTGGKPGGGNGSIGGNGSGRKGSRFGWYAAKVQTAIADSLRRNPATRATTFSLQVKVWPDANGRITRVQLVGSSGDPAVDQAIRNQALTGLQLPEAPPADMPTPIVLRLTASKPAP